MKRNTEEWKGISFRRARFQLGFQRQADGKSQVGFTQSLKDTKERTEEDGVKGEGWIIVSGGIEEIFFLIRSLQDGDRHGTVSDGG